MRAEIQTKFEHNLKITIFLTYFYSVLKLTIVLNMMHMGMIPPTILNFSLLVIPFILSFLFHKSKNPYVLITFLLFLIITKLIYSLVWGFPIYGLASKLVFAYFFIKTIYFLLRKKKLGLTL